MKNAFVILHQGNVLDGLVFESEKRAKNYIVMTYSKRKFKEVSDGVFVCTRFGSTFKVIELYYIK